MSTSVHEGAGTGVEEWRPPLPTPIDEQELTVEALLAQSDKIQHAMQQGMTEGLHYGKIPGVNKPTLLKPGAEKLAVMFRLAPHYQSEKIWHTDGHLTASVVCTLKHAPTGMVISQGEGLCTSRESKYAFRQGKRTCPTCRADALVRSTKKKAYFCISNEGGCGARFAFDTDQARAIDGQDTSRVPNPDLPDTFNTVLKMADKRAFVAAMLNATAASDVFTQDVEDSAAAAATEKPPAEPEQQRPVYWDDEGFNPATDLDPAAPKNPEEIGKLMQDLDYMLGDWARGAIQALYGVESIGQVDKGTEPWYRIANALHRIQQELFKDGDFPPPTDEEYARVWSWAFDGVLVAPAVLVKPTEDDDGSAEDVEAEVIPDAEVEGQLPGTSAQGYERPDE